MYHLYYTVQGCRKGHDAPTLTDKLTLFQLCVWGRGQIMPTTLLGTDPPDFWTFRSLCTYIHNLNKMSAIQGVSNIYQKYISIKLIYYSTATNEPIEINRIENKKAKAFVTHYAIAGYA